MQIEDVTDIVEFPRALQGIVYVLFWERPGGTRTPFYVGQTGRFLPSRMAEYLYSNFQASTDFKVGEAIRYLIEVKRVRILVGQVKSENPIADEHALIKSLETKMLLLNRKFGYDYKTSNKAEVLSLIHAFCDRLLEPENGQHP